MYHIYSAGVCSTACAVIVHIKVCKALCSIVAHSSIEFGKELLVHAHPRFLHLGRVEALRLKQELGAFRRVLAADAHWCWRR